MSPSADRSRKRKLLVVECPPATTSLLLMLFQHDFEVLTAGDLHAAVEVARRESIVIGIIGVSAPFVFYERFVFALRQARPLLPLLFLLERRPARNEEIGFPDCESLVEPFAIPNLRQKIQDLLSRKDWGEAETAFSFPLPGQDRIRRWFFSSRVPSGLRENVLQVASSCYPVFIRGAQGSGTSELAKSIHVFGPFKDRPFLRFSCRGLTTGHFFQKLLPWIRTKYFQQDEALTLFLEQVDQSDGDLQTALLDLWNEQRICWPGLDALKVETRLISSSVFPLADAVSEGRLREDLYHILEILPVTLPSLYERKEEIPRLVKDILQEHGIQKKFSSAALERLQEYSWPGNLYELENVVLRSAQRKREGPLVPQDLIFSFTPEGNGAALSQKKETRDRVSPTGIQSGTADPFFDTAVSLLSHEMKNPLVAITTFAQLLPEKYDDPEFREEFSPLVNVEVKRINRLLDNLSEYVHFSSPVVRPNDLNLLISEVFEDPEAGLAQNGVRPSLHLMENLPPVLFDRGQLKYVLRKILELALDEMSEKKELDVSTDILEQNGKKFVQLVLAYKGREGVLRRITRSIQEIGGEEAELELKNLNLGFMLILRIIARNGGEMQAAPDNGNTSIRILFSTGGSPL